MMNPPIDATLNQQLMSDAAMGQQGMMAEAQGNALVAAQLYEQAIGWIQQSMGTAQQWGVFIPHGVHAALVHAHACAGRAKTALGQPPNAWPHWQQALFELNQALTQCPQFAPYHAAGGGSPAGADQHPDWMKTVNNACSMLDQVFKTVGGFQDMVSKFG